MVSIERRLKLGTDYGQPLIDGKRFETKATVGMVPEVAKGFDWFRRFQKA
jgi:hypothetical protein